MLFTNYDTTVLKDPNRGLDPIVLKAVQEHDNQSFKHTYFKPGSPNVLYKRGKYHYFYFAGLSIFPSFLIVCIYYSFKAVYHS